MFTMM